MYKGVQELGWVLDYKRFRVWLREKYHVVSAYLFIGLMPGNQDLYNSLREAGYNLVFKEVVYDNAGKPKGNCDADLVLHVTCDAYESNMTKAIIVTSDGDYASLVKFLQGRGQIEVVLSPARQEKCSVLLKRTGVRISYLSEQYGILAIQKPYRKSPR